MSVYGFSPKHKMHNLKIYQCFLGKGIKFSNKLERDDPNVGAIARDVDRRTRE